jgi:phytoene dehydrogenase-like protein
VAARDIIVIGAGQNSLVAAFYLARAGHQPLVLERRSTVGGAAAIEEFHPGFRASILDNFHGPLAPAIIKDMHLASNAAQSSSAHAAIFAPHPDCHALLLHRDARQSAGAIASFSKSDAVKYLELDATLRAARPLIHDLLLTPPPEIDHPSSIDIWNLLRAGRAFRKLGKKNMQRLIRWGPMAVADFVAEFFDTELLRATLASRGIFGAAAGPWSAGTTALLLLRLGAGGLPDGNSAAFHGGLPNALASAAQKAGAEIRTNAEVARILVKDGAVSGVALATGEEISARGVVSGTDPKRTFLDLLEPVHLAPSFLAKMHNYRSRGVVARIFLALDALPNFAALKNLSPTQNGDGALAARIHIGPEIDYLERAFDASKYGHFSSAPYLEASIPSLLDPSLAPAGKHVMSIHMQYAPYNLNSEPQNSSRPSEREGFSGGRSFSSSVTNASSSGSSAPEAASPLNWTSQRDALADTVIGTLAQYAPDLPSKILARRVITPLDLEQDYALTGGHISHGELALDQLFTMRPLLGFARYATPIRGLFLCGPGTHPGVALAGASALNASRQITKSLRPSHK